MLNEKPLAAMTLPELEAEAQAAHQAYAAADYIDVARDWTAARAAAEMRIRAVEAEMMRRASGEQNG
jgi:hypothetical protein